MLDMGFLPDIRRIVDLSAPTPAEPAVLSHVPG